MEGDELVPTQEPPFPSGICAWGREREKLERTTRTGGLAKEIPWICPAKPLGGTFLEGLSPSFHRESGKGFFAEIKILTSMSFQSENQTCSGVSFGGNGICSHPWNSIYIPWTYSVCVGEYLMQAEVSQALLFQS